MKDNFLVVVDADAIIAQAYTDDPSYEEALSIGYKLITLKAKLIYPTTAITEAVTMIQRKLNNYKLALAVALSFNDPRLELVKVDEKIVKNAANKYFSKVKSKNNTLFDCVVAAVAEERKVDAVFSFDNFYEKQGFKLASKLK